jgi:hypothetical protein
MDILIFIVAILLIIVGGLLTAFILDLIIHYDPKPVKNSVFLLVIGILMFSTGLGLSIYIIS